MKEKIAVKGIIFDMDGVLIDSLKAHVKCWKKVYAEIGIKIDGKDIEKNEGMPAFKLIKKILEEKGEKISFQEQKEMHRKKREHMKKESIKPYPNVKEEIQVLKKKGIKLAVVTGSIKKFANEKIKEHFPGYFEEVITSEDTKKGKPNADPYELASKKLNLKKDEIIVIENAPLGIQSAKKAGLKVYALATTLSKEELEEADKIFKNHKELFEYLEKK